MVWKAELTNNEAVLQLLTSRIVSDYESTAPKVRKALNLKDLEPRLYHSIPYTCFLSALV